MRFILLTTASISIDYRTLAIWPLIVHYDIGRYLAERRYFLEEAHLAHGAVNYLRPYRQGPGT